jgi:hypothetical protein
LVAVISFGGRTTSVRRDEWRERERESEHESRDAGKVGMEEAIEGGDVDGY